MALLRGIRATPPRAPHLANILATQYSQKCRRAECSVRRHFLFETITLHPIAATCGRTPTLSPWG